MLQIIVCTVPLLQESYRPGTVAVARLTGQPCSFLVKELSTCRASTGMIVQWANTKSTSCNNGNWSLYHSISFYIYLYLSLFIYDVSHENWMFKHHYFDWSITLTWFPLLLMAETAFRLLEGGDDWRKSLPERPVSENMMRWQKFYHDPCGCAPISHFWC